MKIAIYSPYLDTVGGGEKYILTIAEALSKDNEVDVLLDKHLYEIGIKKITEKISKLHGINLEKVNFIRSPIGKSGGFFKRLFFLPKYDWLFYLTDGSIFYSTAKNSVVHFQVPFTAPPTGIWGKIKLSSWKKAIYNSRFTENIVGYNWGIKGEVIYPPVSTQLFKPLNKKRQVLSVGRFFGYLKDKKYEVLIKAFKELSTDGKVKGWSLHLAGAASESDLEYVNELKKIADGFDIYFYPNIKLNDLAILCGESSIYWHAMGYGEDDPKKFEHFGITTVEAMSSGVVPVVINKGGLKEIVEHGVSGYLWDSVEQLEEFTRELISNNTKYLKMSKKAIEKSKDFDKEKFIQKIRGLVYGR